MIESTIPVRMHGRFLVRPGPSASMLVGFHGYGESADDQMPRLAAIRGSDTWTLVAIQGLHRFYERRTDRVVASWMTRQDRELAIADNVAYVSRVLDQVLDGREPGVTVFAGFSQGVAMAYRAAVAARASKRFVIAVGGDVPPEIGPAALATLSGVLVCHGVDDPWYSREAFERDVHRLRAMGPTVEAHVVAGGHEWSRDVTAAASTFIAGRANPQSQSLIPNP
jgi:predicted esterase